MRWLLSKLVFSEFLLEVGTLLSVLLVGDRGGRREFVGSRHRRHGRAHLGGRRGLNVRMDQGMGLGVRGGEGGAEWELLRNLGVILV